MVVKEAGMRASWKTAALAAASVAVALWFPPPAKADNTNVQALLGFCSEGDGSPNWLYCAGLVSGISTILQANGTLNATAKSPAFLLLSICPVQAPTIATNIQVFKSWATAHPENWNMQDYVGVATSLHQTWPCR